MEKITGQLSKITTTADQSVRLTIDIPFESAGEIMAWLYQMVKIELMEVSNDNNR
jgi:hypothetical protein